MVIRVQYSACGATRIYANDTQILVNNNFVRNSCLIDGHSCLKMSATQHELFTNESRIIHK